MIFSSILVEHRDIPNYIRNISVSEAENSYLSIKGAVAQSSDNIPSYRRQSHTKSRKSVISMFAQLFHRNFFDKWSL